MYEAKYAQAPRLRRTIADVMIDLMTEQNRSNVGWGDLDLLDECASLSYAEGLAKKSSNEHPLDRHKRILNALGRSKRFEKFLFRVWVGNREGLARAFRLREQPAASNNVNQENK